MQLGHGFDSRRGLRFFLCPTLVTNWNNIFLKNYVAWNQLNEPLIVFPGAHSEAYHCTRICPGWDRQSKQTKNIPAVIYCLVTASVHVFLNKSFETSCCRVLAWPYSYPVILFLGWYEEFFLSGVVAIRSRVYLNYSVPSVTRVRPGRQMKV